MNMYRNDALDQSYAMQKRIESTLFWGLPRSRDELDAAHERMKRRAAEMRAKSCQPDESERVFDAKSGQPDD